MNDAPDEIIENIGQHLSLSNIHKYQQLSQRFHRLSWTKIISGFSFGIKLGYKENDQLVASQIDLIRSFVKKAPNLKAISLISKERGYWTDRPAFLQAFGQVIPPGIRVRFVGFYTDSETLVAFEKNPIEGKHFSGFSYISYLLLVYFFSSFPCSFFLISFFFFDLGFHFFSFFLNPQHGF